MEQKLVRVPFDLEMAKKITEKSVEGKIVTRNGRSARIICFDAHCDDNIVALIEGEKGVEYPKSYVSDGMIFLTCESEYDLMLEIPEYMTLKDGDVYTTPKGGIGIYNSSYITSCDSIPFYVGVRYDGELIFRKSNDYAGFGSIKESRLSTEEEKQELIDALKESKELKAKKYLKRFFGIEAESKYVKYKDGDILRAYDNIVIIKNPCVDDEGKFKFKQYAGYCCNLNKLVDCDLYYDQQAVRYANDKEKEIIKQAMKESGNPMYDNILKQFFGIEQKQEYEFKPFDKVLVRDSDDKRWIPNFFWSKGDMMFRTIGGTFWNQCIPYNEQTAHLLGTTDNWEE